MPLCGVLEFLQHCVIADLINGLAEGFNTLLRALKICSQNKSKDSVFRANTCQAYLRLNSYVYFNYDRLSDKALLAENPVFFEAVDRHHAAPPLVILDEIHKYKDWKGYLKSIYDEYADLFHFLITGSGRLDLMTQQGDALAGRFLRFRLLPFTLGELFASQPRTEDFSDLLNGLPPQIPDAQETMNILLLCSGFPEPFLKASQRSYRRWAQSYHRQIIRDDIRELTAIRNLSALETLFALLPQRVCNPLFIAALTNPLRVSHKTVSSWLDVFERLFLLFKIRPYSKRVTRSLVKEPKYYFFGLLYGSG